MVLLATGSIVARKTWFNKPAEATSSWEAASAFVLPKLQQGDAITTFPEWDRTGFPSLEPKSEFMLHRDPILAEDLQKIKRLWIITPTDRRDEALAALPFSVSKPEQETQEGIVTVMLVVVPDDLRWEIELADLLGNARVEHGSKGKLTECKSFDKKRASWRCARGARVSLEEREIVSSGRTCMEVAFGKEKTQNTTRVIFKDLAVGKKLRLRAGWTLESLRKKRERPGELSWTVSLGGESLDARTFPTTDRWHLLEFDTSGMQGKQDLALEFQASSPAKTEFCFNGWIEK
jgi:hypothetical protein